MSREYFCIMDSEHAVHAQYTKEVILEEWTKATNALKVARALYDQALHDTEGCANRRMAASEAIRKATQSPIPLDAEQQKEYANALEDWRRATDELYAITNPAWDAVVAARAREERATREYLKKCI